MTLLLCNAKEEEFGGVRIYLEVNSFLCFSKSLCSCTKLW
jgi:hypothetical protein